MQKKNISIEDTQSRLNFAREILTIFSNDSTIRSEFDETFIDSSYIFKRILVQICCFSNLTDKKFVIVIFQKINDIYVYLKQYEDYIDIDQFFKDHIKLSVIQKLSINEILYYTNIIISRITRDIFLKIDEDKDEDDMELSSLMLNDI